MSGKKPESGPSNAGNYGKRRAVRQSDGRGKRKKIRIDLARLSQLLGIPVVGAVQEAAKDSTP
jgi:hypothetical protein